MEIGTTAYMAGLKPTLKAAFHLGLIREIAVSPGEIERGGFTAAPRCHECSYRREVPGNTHLACANHAACVLVHSHGHDRGQVLWPFSFTPAWIAGCDGFSAGVPSGKSTTGLPLPVVVTMSQGA